MTRNRPARALLAAGVASFGLLSCAPVPERTRETVSGRARVVDGDTLKIAGRHLRLAGIDAPELRQTCLRDGRRWPCGRQAAQALIRKVGARSITCTWREVDRWNRPVATCRLGEADLSGWLVERGWALAFRRYATTYVADERRAETARRGIWSGSFVPPWEYRAG